MGVRHPPHRAPGVHHLPQGGRDSAAPESFCRAQEWGGLPRKQDKAKLQVRDSNIGQGDLTEGSAGRKGPACAEHALPHPHSHLPRPLDLFLSRLLVLRTPWPAQVLTAQVPLTRGCPCRHLGPRAAQVGSNWLGPPHPDPSTQSWKEPPLWVSLWGLRN